MRVKPKVSVIVPVYNVESYITRCLETLVSQTLEDIEILVVNDGSPDGSQAIVDTFVERYPDKVISLIKPNGGLSSARNFGLDHARGDYIGFVDGDDFVQPDMYERLYQRAVSTDADMVVCSYKVVDLNTGEEIYFRAGGKRHYGKSLAEMPSVLLAVPPYAWNKLFAKHLFDESGVRFPEGKLFEDIPVTYSLMALANKIEKIPVPLYNYLRFRVGAITHSYSPRNLEMLDTLSELVAFYQRAGLFETYRPQLLFLNFRHVFNRFAELPEYDGAGIKQEFVNRAWEHLDRYFPDWRDDPLVNERYANEWRFWFFKHWAPMHAYALAPRVLHAMTDAVSNARRAVQHFLKRFSRDRLARLRYARSRRDAQVAKDVVLFESFHGKNITDSPFYLMRELSARGTHRLYVTTTDVAASERFLSEHGIIATPVLLESPLYTRILAAAGCLVNNVTFPPYFAKRDGQVYLNTWHGTPLKTLGKSMPAGTRDLQNIQRNFLAADYLLFANEFTRDHMMRDYMLNGLYAGQDLVMGSPRNEPFFDQELGHRIREELGVSDKKVVVYMPTWRGGNTRQMDVDSYSRQVEDHLWAIDSALSDDVVFYVKFHTLVMASIDIEDYQHIRPAPTNYETYEFLSAADCLVTDYSSVFFDFASTGKEIVLFAYDRDEYLAERNLYMPLESLPFPVVTSIEELTACLTRTEPFVADDAYRVFASEFAKYDSSHASRAVIDRIFCPVPDAGAAPEGDSGERIPPEVSLVFLPQLSESGLALFKRLVDAGRGRDREAFVFRARKMCPQTDEYLYSLYADEGQDINYIVTGDRMQLTVAQSLALWLEKHFGWSSRFAQDAYALELRRLFGITRIRSAEDVSNSRKFTMLTELINGSTENGRAED